MVGPVMALEWGATGQRLFVGSARGTESVLLDGRTGARVGTASFPGDVTAAWIDDGDVSRTTAFVGVRGGSVLLWDLRARSPTLLYKSVTSGRSCAACLVHPGGSAVLVEHTFAGNLSAVRRRRLRSPTARRVTRVVLCAQRDVRCAGRGPSRTYRASAVSRRACGRVCLSSSGSVVFAGGLDDGHARGWDVASSEAVFLSSDAVPDVPTSIAVWDATAPSMIALGWSGGCTVLQSTR